LIKVIVPPEVEAPEEDEDAAVAVELDTDAP
jgi:hypothetical protein